jgi:hypothetical protein
VNKNLEIPILDKLNSNGSVNLFKKLKEKSVVISSDLSYKLNSLLITSLKDELYIEVRNSLSNAIK